MKRRNTLDNILLSVTQTLERQIRDHKLEQALRGRHAMLIADTMAMQGGGAARTPAKARLPRPPDKIDRVEAAAEPGSRCCEGTGACDPLPGSVPPDPDPEPEPVRRRAPRAPVARPVDDCALWRLDEVLRRFPVSRSAWYAGMADGRYPQPVRLGPRSVAWRPWDIQVLIESL